MRRIGTHLPGNHLKGARDRVFKHGGIISQGGVQGLLLLATEALWCLQLTDLKSSEYF